jgi:hypothetical protein
VWSYNRPTTTNGASASAVTSDADGNTLTDTGGRTMTWDSQNRLVSCTKGGVTNTYTYGADGLRRNSTVNGITTYYAYDGQTMIREMRRNPQRGALVNTATYLQGMRGAECRRDDTQTETDSQGRQVSACRWYVYDGLGSVVGEVDPSGTLTSSPKYDVYGTGLPSGISTLMPMPSVWRCWVLPLMLVSIAPGQTALTRMPCCPSSTRAAIFMNATCPALLAL